VQDSAPMARDWISAKQLTRHWLARLGFGIVSLDKSDFDPEFLEIYRRCSPFTMTSIERMYALYQATRYVVEHEVPGDVVECGVWRGGSSMLAAMTLDRAGDRQRALHLFDTFEGMTRPTQEDGGEAFAEWSRLQDDDVNRWCYAALEEVEANMRSTGIAAERVRLVQGRVEDTIPEAAPTSIAILRLDTDWYQSTYHELCHLFPRLSPEGVLIIDDYGRWDGARQAVDQYFDETGERILLNRIDPTGRIGVRATAISRAGSTN
jgi:O-methyltransferase